MAFIGTVGGGAAYLPEVLGETLAVTSRADSLAQRQATFAQYNVTIAINQDGAGVEKLFARSQSQVFVDTTLRQVDKSTGATVTLSGPIIFTVAANGKLEQAIMLLRPEVGAPVRSIEEATKHHAEAYIAGNLDAIMQDFAPGIVRKQIVKVNGQTVENETYTGADEVRSRFAKELPDVQQNVVEPQLDHISFHGLTATVVWHTTVNDVGMNGADVLTLDAATGLFVAHEAVLVIH